jgi:CrcB protein
MKELLAVAAGGAFGAVSRYLVYVLAGQFLGTGFPFGTLIVNVVGSFLMGVLAEGTALVWTVNPQLRLFVAVGILGAFTTFSTFSLDVAVLYERGRLGLVSGYIMVSVICSIGALFAGMYLVRQVYEPAL